MEQAGERLFIYHTDHEMDSLLPPGLGRLDIPTRFNQNEEFFLVLPSPLLVTSLPIHHDVQQKFPDAARREAMAAVVAQLGKLVPGLLGGFQWFFDASECLRISFYQLSEIQDANYITLLRIDLAYRPMIHRLVAAGDNDRTAAYETDRLFLDVDIVPLRGLTRRGGMVEMAIRQTVSETWIGETGRGYFVQGIWLDRELTKFFSKLFLPAGKRLFPYFPVNCKFRAVCGQPFRLDAAGRHQGVELLHACRAFLEVRVPAIEKALHRSAFSEELPLFQQLRGEAPGGIRQVYEPLSMRSYLNQQEMKEYELSYETK
jgi:hypothetical protein